VCESVMCVIILYIVAHILTHNLSCVCLCVVDVDACACLCVCVCLCESDVCDYIMLLYTF